MCCEIPCRRQTMHITYIIQSFVYCKTKPLEVLALQPQMISVLRPLCSTSELGDPSIWMSRGRSAFNFIALFSGNLTRAIRLALLTEHLQNLLAVR